MVDLESELRSALAGQAQHIAVHQDFDAVERDAITVDVGPRPVTSRRGRNALLVAAASVVAVAGIAATTLLDASGRSVAWAGWTPAAQPARPEDIAAISDACASAMSDSQHPDPGAPIAVDIRGTGGFVVFDSGSTCSAQRPDARSGFRVATTSYSWEHNQYRDALDQLADTASAVAVTASESEDPPNSFVWGVASPDIDAVTIHTPHGSVEAVVAGPVWLAWWPEATGFDLTVDGLTSDGTVVVAGTFGELQLSDLGTPGQAACADDSDDCPALRVAEIVDAAAAGTLAEDVLRDGYVDDTEFADWIASVTACMTDQGYDITITARADGVRTDYPTDGQPGPVEPALAACEAPGGGISELRVLQQAHPEHWSDR